VPATAAATHDTASAAPLVTNGSDIEKPTGSVNAEIAAATEGGAGGTPDATGRDNVVAQA
jgi:hypothetical protein